MKTYKKNHISKKALNDHIDKIKERGGVYEITGTSIRYSFPDKKITNSQALAIVSNKIGNSVWENNELNMLRNLCLKNGKKIFNSEKFSLIAKYI